MRLLRCSALGTDLRYRIRVLVRALAHLDFTDRRSAFWNGHNYFSLFTVLLHDTRRHRIAVLLYLKFVQGPPTIVTGFDVTRTGARIQIYSTDRTQAAARLRAQGERLLLKQQRLPHIVAQI